MQFTTPPATAPAAVASHGARFTQANRAKPRSMSTHDAACDDAIERRKVGTSESLCIRVSPTRLAFCDFIACIG